MLHTDQQTIIAQCTPSGNGAIALLRLSGNDAIAIASKIGRLASGQTINSQASHVVRFGWVIDEYNNRIDQVMFLIMYGPKSFTGQNTVEITCHNSPFVVQAIIQQAITYGARLAQEGEFSRRAVLNQKIDLTQAEAINELIKAQTQHALRKSLSQLEGSLSAWVNQIQKNIIKSIALCEASFEFLDEEMDFSPNIRSLLELCLAEISKIKNTYNQQELIRDGIRIVLLGTVNAGKSSLFNTIIGKNRAIVTNIEGTTRDSIEAGIMRKQTRWTLVDTAGLRETNNIIEQHGINRSLSEAAQADIIILVLDRSRTLSEQEFSVYKKLYATHDTKIVLVHSKGDLDLKTNFNISPTVTISSITKDGINTLLNVIDKKAESLLSAIDSPFLINQRQHALLNNLELDLQQICIMLESNPQYELISCHLNTAATHLSELTGKSISEYAMDAVFKDFCVGK